MSRSALALALLLTLNGGCQSASGPGSSASGSSAFDCVRERGGVLISAHRAVSAPNQPENSLAAIRATAVAIPGSMVEIDVRRTADDVLVLMHDRTLDRTSTGSGRVGALSFDAVRRARLVDGAGRATDEPPPSLDEALAEARRAGVLVAVDLKADGDADLQRLARDVAAAVRRAGLDGRAMMISASERTSELVAGAAPGLMISAPVDDVADLTGLEPGRVIAWTGTRRPDPTLWDALRSRGVEVQFGTLGPAGRRLDDRYAADGDLSEYRDLAAGGASLIATDAPLAAYGVLRAEAARAATCFRR